MSTREPVIYAMPNGYELGMFVQQIAEQDAPRAIILDFLQRTILVHPPSEDGVDKSEFTADSLAFLLSSVELEHTELSASECVEAYASAGQQYWFCAHPNLEESETILHLKERPLWTKIVEPGYLLLVIKSLDQDRPWKVIGMTVQSEQDT